MHPLPQENFQQADATIISDAAVPKNPSSPQRKILFVLSVALAVVRADRGERPEAADVVPFDGGPDHRDLGADPDAAR